MFSLGTVVATPAAIDALSAVGLSPLSIIRRHQRGDWSEMHSEDAAANFEAVKTGKDRIFSSYNLPGSTEKVWCITEWDRSVTTVLLPEDY